MRALRELHAEGSLTTYGEAVLTKGADGKVSTKEDESPGPRGTALGAPFGGLVGLLGGPAVDLLGAAGGALTGGWRDVLNLGVGTDFLDEVSRELMPGRKAAVADLDEDRVTPLGGVVFRQGRADFEDEQFEKEVNLRRADLTQLEAEEAQAGEERRTKLKARVDEARAKCRETSERAKAALDRLEEETNAKVAALQEQAARATGDTKARIEHRVAELRADRDRRDAGAAGCSPDEARGSPAGQC